MPSEALTASSAGIAAENTNEVPLMRCRRQQTKLNNVALSFDKRSYTLPDGQQRALFQRRNHQSHKGQ